MIQLTLLQVQFGVEALPNGQTILAFHDQNSGIQVHVPLDPQARDKLASQLREPKLAIANQVPNGEPG